MLKIPFKSNRIACTGARSFRVVLSAILLIASGCVSVLRECDPDVGECPTPDPRIYANTLGLTKSLWFEDARITHENVNTGLALCARDLLSLSGTELMFRSPDRA